MLEQKGESVVYRFGINYVVVVEDDYKIVPDFGDFVEQRCQNRFRGRRLGRFERAQQAFTNIRCDCLQSSDKVGQKACRVVTPSVERQPCSGWTATAEPLADQCGFAKTGRGGDESHFAPQGVIQAFDQAGTEDKLGPRRGDVKLSG